MRKCKEPKRKFPRLSRYLKMLEDYLYQSGQPLTWSLMPGKEPLMARLRTHH
jgi:hypothetical protein